MATTSSSSSTTSKASLLRSLLIILPGLILSSYFAYLQHSTLPSPIHEPYNAQTGRAQLSESNILNHSQYLSETIGYRTVGSREHALGDAWMLDQAHKIRSLCEEVVRQAEAEGRSRNLECEVWRQEGSGSHRFDIMGKRVYKTYVNLSNIIIRISNGTPKGKEHAVLINAHLDSTLPSPGAADDAISVAVMLECARVLVEDREWEPEWAIVFLFNNAEESLQDGSHLYTTQHETASTIRAAINLEAAGTTGRELLFQATSQEMIEAYSHVPRPFGTIFANDIFSSGVLLSDTDFRQFELYLNVTGLDMAIVGNSYLYHMRKDLVENIAPGVAQHMAENTLALLHHMSSSLSPLPSLTTEYTPPTTVFFSHLGQFFIYSFSLAKVLYGSLLACAVLFALKSSSVPGSRTATGAGVWKMLFRGWGVAVGTSFGALISANVIAVLMSYGLGKGMSWFSSEYYGILLYAPPALLGSLLPLLLLPQVPEKTLISSIIVLQASIAFTVQLLNVGSAALLFITSFAIFLGLLGNEILARKGSVSIWTYTLGLASPVATGTLLMLGVIEFFAPLTGRMGADIPADNIIATIVAVVGTITLPLLPAFASRFPKKTLRRWIGVLLGLTVVVMAVFAGMNPYDAMHQKRVFILHYEDVHSHEHSLHMAASDGAPGFPELVQEVSARFGTGEVEKVKMDGYNSDWNSLYPFSAVLAPYKLTLPTVISAPFSQGFTVVATQDLIDTEAGTRALKLTVNHPGVIWSVIAFDAHVLSWTLDDNPPNEHARHHIKEASFYGTDAWELDLVIKLPSPSSSPATPQERLRIDFTGIRETAMWPGKKAEKEKGGDAMVLFEELDGWLFEEKGDRVDALMLGCVGGSVLI